MSQVLRGNIPLEIAQNTDITVILLRQVIRRITADEDNQ